MTAQPKSKIKVLAYVFGCKVTEQTGPNQFAVRFIDGVSDTFPKKYKNYKDFWCNEIHEGDFSPLFADAVEVETYFQKEKANVISSEFYGEEWTKRQEWFRGVCTREEWNVLTALSYVLYNFSMAHMVIETPIIADILHREAGVVDADLAVLLLDQFQEINVAIYNAEMAEFAKRLGQ
jgi:hypothetical protein